MSDIVITAAKRTPVGSFLGAFSSTPAHVLGQTAIQAALEQAGVSAEEVDEVILGHVLTAGLGQNPARQAAVAAGIPVDRTAFAINQVCGSGLRAVALAAQAIALGDARIMVAGGQENMSLAPHAQFLRAGQKMGNVSLIDTMIVDGLTDAFNGYHMGITAENLAEKYQISREAQDAFAVASQNKASAARSSGRFKDEITPVTVKGRKGDTIVDTDEYIRDGATIEAMSGLKPAFKKDGGSITAVHGARKYDKQVVRTLPHWRSRSSEPRGDGADDALQSDHRSHPDLDHGRLLRGASERWFADHGRNLTSSKRYGLRAHPRRLE